MGSIAAAAFIKTVHPANYTGTLAATVLHPEMEPWQGVLVEIWLTFILVLTILGATNQVRKVNIYMPTLIIMLAVGNGVSCGFNSTGGSMNPARSLGPAVIADIWEYHWI
jgi:glycerol uptake facilitator-like aquaporin